jgi:DNA-binding NarL/FixJ family response regulator
MHQSRAPLRGQGVFFAAQFSAGYITNMPAFDLRQAQIPDARFAPLESRNHILLDTDEAWEQFAGEIDEFLSVPGDNSPALLLDGLTARERDVLEYVAQGLTNGAISKRLKIAEKTVRNHVSIILSKLGVSSRTHAVVIGRQAGFGRRLSPE